MNLIDFQDDNEHRDETKNLVAQIDNLEHENRALRDLVVELSLGKAAAEWELSEPEAEAEATEEGVAARLNNFMQRRNGLWQLSLRVKKTN